VGVTSGFIAARTPRPLCGLSLVEGNRRAVFTPILVFLGLNGIDFDVSPAAATAMILALAAGETDGLARWIEDNISPPSGRPPPQAPSISA
jgi:hypothetical protein